MSAQVARPASAAPPSWRVLARDEADTWLFVLRALLSLFVAGWLAMRLQLEQPSTAMLTAVIVMNRQTGMVLAKSFYRVIGTLAGAAMALLLMAAFPQQHALLLLAMALWLGVCAGGATLYRNFKSYAFVLSGYTASIVLLPAIPHPAAVFDTASARVGEVLLGILVSGVVSDVVFPTRMRDTLRATARTQFRDFIAFVRDAVGGDVARADMERAHLRFVRDAVALEDLRSSVVFEDAEARARSGSLRLFNQRFMVVSTSFQSLHQLLNRLLRGSQAPVADAVMALYRPLSDALRGEGEIDSRALQPRVAAYVDALPARIDAAAPAFAATPAGDDYDTAAELLLRFARELRAYVDVAASLRTPGAPGGSIESARFTRGNDVAGAAITMARTVVVMLGLGAFWIFSGWPSGGSAMLLAAIFCALFGAAAQPVAASGSVLRGFLLGTPVAFAMTFFVLPRLDGYAMLVAAMLPFCIVGILASTSAAWSGIGTGYMIALVSMSGIANPMHYDPAAFVNGAAAQLLGLGASVAAFQLIPTATGSRWLRARQLAALRRQVAIAAHAPLDGLRHRFESVNRDLFHQIVASTAPGSDASRALLAWALAVHETGRAIIELRHDAQATDPPPALRAALGTTLAAIAALFDAPRADRHAAARAAVTDAIATVRASRQRWPQARRLLHHLHLLRIGLTDADSALARYLPQPSATEAGDAA